MSEEKLNMNKEEFSKLKKAYKKAKEADEESFIFQDKEILTSYAKYLIEYLNSIYK